jgi:hypothetical protein
MTQQEIPVAGGQWIATFEPRCGGLWSKVLGEERSAVCAAGMERALAWPFQEGRGSLTMLTLTFTAMLGLCRVGRASRLSPSARRWRRVGAPRRFRLSPHDLRLSAGLGWKQAVTLVSIGALILAQTPNSSLANTVLSPAEVGAAQARAFLNPVAYGNALERLVARDINSSPLHRSLFQPVGGASNPDFIGLGSAVGMNFDITTFGQINAHLARPIYGVGLNVIPYQRPLGWTVP